MGRLQKIVRGIDTKVGKPKREILEHLSLSGMEMYKVSLAKGHCGDYITWHITRLSS